MDHGDDDDDGDAGICGHETKKKISSSGRLKNVPKPHNNFDTRMTDPRHGTPAVTRVAVANLLMAVLGCAETCQNMCVFDLPQYHVLVADTRTVILVMWKEQATSLKVEVQKRLTSDRPELYRKSSS